MKVFDAHTKFLGDKVFIFAFASDFVELFVELLELSTLAHNCTGHEEGGNERHVSLADEELDAEILETHPHQCEITFEIEATGTSNDRCWLSEKKR